MGEFLLSLLGPDPEAGLFVILNLVMIESLLSIDNAAVLATMVMDLPEGQRQKALRYGILGAYFFRGLCLLTASYLLQFTWLKLVGGAYLIYLFVSHFRKSVSEEAEEVAHKDSSPLYRWIVKALGGQFWATVVFVEIMDLAFSLDNVFAAVAFTENLMLICTGVFIGILAMRFVAQGFVKLLTRYGFLENIAFLVIGLLGLKLVGSYVADFFPENAFAVFFNSHEADLYVSLLTILLFVVPVASAAFFNFPARTDKSPAPLQAQPEEKTEVKPSSTPGNLSYPSRSVEEVA